MANRKAQRSTHWPTGDLTRSDWQKWPDEQAGPWVVRLYRAEVEGRYEVVGVELWHGVMPHALESATKWHAIRLPGPSAIKATDLRKLRIGELIAADSANLRAGAQSTRRRAHDDPRAFAKQLGAENAAKALKNAERLLGPPKSTGRPRKYGLSHFADVAAVYNEADRIPGTWPTKAVKEHFKVSPSLAAKWVSECRKLGLVKPATQRPSKSSGVSRQRGPGGRRNPGPNKRREH